VFDFTDPEDPDELASYRTDDTSFWTAVQARSYTVASDIGGGVLFLHNDRGEKQPPGFSGDVGGGDGPGPSNHRRPK